MLTLKLEFYLLVISVYYYSVQKQTAEFKFNKLTHVLGNIKSLEQNYKNLINIVPFDFHNTNITKLVLFLKKHQKTDFVFSLKAALIFVFINLMASLPDN